MKIDDKVDAIYIPDDPSHIKADDYNQIKNEIQNCITLAGLTPTKDVIQLPTALQKLTEQSSAAAQAEINAVKEAAIASISQSNTTAQTEITNTKNDAIDEINATGIDGRVSKSGDTMTGTLTVPTVAATTKITTVTPAAGSNDTTVVTSAWVRNYLFNTAKGLTMPDYASQITGSMGSGAYVKCAKDSFVTVWGSDSYIADCYGYISPDNGTTTYIVGHFQEDRNSNTHGTSFSFFVPAGWSFTATFENGNKYRIYPLSGR